MRQSLKELARFVLGLALEPNVRATGRSRAVKVVLWALAGIGVVAAAARLARGLGSTTNLSDVTPWGLWIGFDVVGGVALAAGGFVVAAAVHILHLKRFEPIVRPAVLTAFLGYGAVIAGLIFDLGAWWNIWRPMFFWQHHSALFEVAWCVMLYFTVLALEFAPVVLEKMPFPRLFAVAKKITLPLVIVGIALSTLHQSSLGTLFLIMPFRLHPLWNSSLQPLLFFLSAVGLGLCMVILESIVSAWLYRRPDEAPMLSGLARVASGVLFVYLAVRLGELTLRGELNHLFNPTWESWAFALEILLCAIIPAVLFAVPRVRTSRGGLLTVAAIAVAGFVLNRINVAGISTVSATGTDYFPAWTEFAVSAGVVAAAALVFLFFVEHFSVYDEPAKQEDTSDRSNPAALGLGGHWAGDGAFYSLVFVVAATTAFALLPDDAVRGARPRPTPVQAVRTVDAVRPLTDSDPFSHLVLAGGTAGADQTPFPAILLDGNRNGRFVIFDHDGHQRRAGKDSCGRCHHLNRPFDKATVCSACHRDMFLATDIFSHELHREKMGDNRGCRTCHPYGQPKTRATATSCLTCHRKMVAPNSIVPFKEEMLRQSATDYTAAMHGLCRDCHLQAIKERPELTEDFGRCAACHQQTDRDFLRRLPDYPAPAK